MFLLNSRLTRFSVAGSRSQREVAHVPPAPLLPKLRGHFAEFLLRNSLEHLRLLASPTCVGLRYGRHAPSSAKLFSAVGITIPLRGSSPLRHRFSATPGGFTYPGTPTTLHRKSTTRRTACSCVPPQTRTDTCRYGNIDPFPIGYAFRPHLRGRLTLS